MNKNTINEEILIAYDVLSETKIAKKEKTGDAMIINRTYRGQISSFGAAVIMGSLLSAIAFFSDDGNSKVTRSCLMDAILLVIKKKNPDIIVHKTLYEYAKDKGDNCKEDIINAAIALKLAMNLYKFDDCEG